MKRIISIVLVLSILTGCLSFLGSASLLDDPDFCCVNASVYGEPEYTHTIELNQSLTIKGRGYNYVIKFVPEEDGVYNFYSFENKKYNNKFYPLVGEIYYWYGSGSNSLAWKLGEVGINSGNFSTSVYMHKGLTYTLRANFYNYWNDSSVFCVKITKGSSPTRDIVILSGPYPEHMVYCIEKKKATMSTAGHTKYACAYCDKFFDDYCYPPKDIKLSKSSFTYTASEIKPSVIATDINGDKFTNYYVNYSNNVNVGQAKAVIHLVGFDKDYTYEKYFTISPKKLTTCGLAAAYTYTGKAIVPVPYYYKTVNGEKVKVNYKKGTDYTIAVSGAHKQVGKYTAVIKFKGNYSGTVKKTFQILPKPVTSVKSIPYNVKSIKAVWKKVPNVSGYRVYRYDFKNGKWVSYKATKSNMMVIPRYRATDREVFFMIKTYKTVAKKNYYNISAKNYIEIQFTKPSTPTVKITNEDFGEINLKFNRIANHQVQLSDNSKYSTSGDHFVITKNFSSTSNVYITGLMSGKRYYIRTREYIRVDGKLYMSGWTKTKSIETY